VDAVVEFFLLTRSGGTISADYLLYHWFARPPS